MIPAGGLQGPRAGAASCHFRGSPPSHTVSQREKWGVSKSRSVAQGAAFLRQGLRRVLGFERLGSLARKDPRPWCGEEDGRCRSRPPEQLFSSPRLRMDSANYP